MKRVLNLLSALAGEDLEGRVTIGQPLAIFGRENTQVAVKGTLATGTYVNPLFRYNRVNLSLIDPFTLTHQGETDVHGLLAQLNTQAFFSALIQTNGVSYSLQHFLETTDIVNEPIQISSGQALSLTLKAVADNHVYTGALRVTLTAP